MIVLGREKMSNIQHKKILSCGAEVFWLVPTGGFGHVADEQPMPFINNNNKLLTPRFGGEECHQESSIQSIPLPWGVLESDWPRKQRLFNFFRRRVNIYWRNLFDHFCRSDKYFYFSQQLNYAGLKNSFFGHSPMVDFQRTFVYRANSIEVKDVIRFKQNLRFKVFNYAMLPELPCKDIATPCVIQCDVKSNKEMKCSSSTGPLIIKYKELTDVTFSKGYELNVNYQYDINYEL